MGEEARMIGLRCGSATDVGRVRETNQDSLLLAEPLFAVADGMGGHQGGEVASATALEVLKRSFDDDHTVEGLVEAVRRANAKVWDQAQLSEELRGMGTTLTAVAVVDPSDEQSEPNQLAIVNVGDSRAYLFRDGELRQVTEDHSLVEEMVRTGQISEQEAQSHPRRNILTRALGVEPVVVADIEQMPPQSGDRVLLCSDGLVRELDDHQIAAVLRRLKNPSEAARELVTQAKAHGGLDNITVIIVDVEQVDLAKDENSAAIETGFGTVAPGADPTVTQSATPPAAAKGAKEAKNVPAGRTHLGALRSIKVTFRLAMFLAAAVVLIGIGVGSVVWYTRDSYFVGLDGQQLVIYRGRSEAVLWFHPTIAERTNASTAQVLPSHLLELQKGAAQSSIVQARLYISNLTAEATNAQQVAQAPVASRTTTGTSQAP